MKNILIIILLFPVAIKAQIITTIAGNGTNGDSGNGGAAIYASINRPYGGVFDFHGNYYFVEPNSNRLRKISSCGIIDLVAGTGVAGFSGDSALAIAAELNSPRWVTTDIHGNIYIADGDNYRIRKIDTTGIIYTIAGNGVSAYSGDSGQAVLASFILPSCICIDSIGNIYIADDGRIRKISTSGIITTVAGNGTIGFSGDSGLAISAEINDHGIYVDKSGNLFIADFYRIREVNPTTGIINTIAGTGISPYNGDGIPAISANFNTIGLVWDSIGNMYTADLDNNRVREIDTSGIIHTIAGTGVAGFSGDGGLADTAEMYDPSGAAFDFYGNLYIPCKENFRIRKITFNPVTIPTVTITSTADTVCSGTSVTFTATVTGSSTPFTYQWLINGSPTGIGSAYTYSPANGDSIRCVISVNGLCVMPSSNTIYMVVNPATTPTITLTSSASATIGSTVTVNAAVSGAGSSYSINWYDNGALFSTTTVPMTTYTKGASTDNITATVIPSPIGMLPGCYDSSTSAAFTITVSNNGVNNVAAQKMYVYPNPASTILNINNVTTQEPYSLLSIVGSTLQRGVLQPGNNTISIEGFAPGIYVLEVTSEAGEKTIRKIAKQ